MKAHIAVIDDDPLILRFVRKVLEPSYHVVLFDSAERFLSVVHDLRPDIVVTDLNLDGHDGFSIIRSITQQYPDIPCVVITSDVHVESAILAMRLGVVDYLTKPISVEEFRLRIQAVLRRRDVMRFALQELEKKRKTYDIGYVSGSDRVGQAIADTFDLATRRYPTFIHLMGPRYTGKRYIARCIHAARSVDGSDPIVVDASAMGGRDLLALLFGKRSDVDPAYWSRGLLSRTDGALIIDHAQALDSDTRERLWLTISEHRYTPIGTDHLESIACCICLISDVESNRGVFVQSSRASKARAYGGFEAECFTCELEYRGADIEHFARRRILSHTQWYGNQSDNLISPRAVEALKSRKWQGGFREFYALVDAACSRAQGHTVDLLHVDRAPSADEHSTRDGYVIPAGLTLKDAQLQYLRCVLENHTGDMQEVSESLGISRKTIWWIRKKHNIQ